jgi:hypothetical protein
MASIEPAARRVTSLGGDKDTDPHWNWQRQLRAHGRRPHPGQALWPRDVLDPAPRRAGGPRRDRPPEVEVSPDFRFATLGEMADTHRAEIRG